MKNLCALASLAVSLLTTTASSGTIFVRASAPGANNGTSWTDAYVSLQDGLAAAMPGDQVWLAEGTYKPDFGVSQTPGSRSATFLIAADIELYGAFLGSEASVDGRLGSAANTVLSGDYADNDDWNTPATFQENAFHVVSIIGTGPRTIDSVSVVGGNAQVNAAPDPASGGGILLESDASALITSCIIRDNYAFRGGGMYITSQGIIDIEHTAIQRNRAVDDGGGVLIDGGAAPTFVSCTLLQNQASGGTNADGGAVFGGNGRFESCLVAGNAARQGAAVYLDSGTGMQITLSTIVDNIAVEVGGGVRGGHLAELTNCIVWANTDQSGASYSSQLAVSGIDLSCSSIIQGYSPTGSACDDLGDDPLFVSSATGDYHLTASSPAINRGIPVSPLPAIDFDGESRVDQCRVDIGADESPFFEDCDENMESDSCQIDAMPSLDVNENGILDACDPQGFPVCFGDGTGPDCPCDNAGAPGHGCNNAQSTGGVKLALLDFNPGMMSAVLHATGFPATSAPTAVGIRGFNLLSAGPGAVVGDGILSLGLPVTRVGTQSASGGALTMPISHGAGPGQFFYQYGIETCLQPSAIRWQRSISATA